MKKDDLFFIHVLDRTLAYKVNQISVVRPEDTRKLRFVDGKDYITLVTYSIRSERSPTVSPWCQNKVCEEPEKQDTTKK